MIVPTVETDPNLP